nr:MAG TPA: hypothetical protein [Caudoviricetes sp.]
MCYPLWYSSNSTCGRKLYHFLMFTKLYHNP